MSELRGTRVQWWSARGWTLHTQPDPSTARHLHCRCSPTHATPCSNINNNQVTSHSHRHKYMCTSKFKVTCMRCWNSGSNCKLSSLKRNLSLRSSSVDSMLLRSCSNCKQRMHYSSVNDLQSIMNRTVCHCYMYIFEELWVLQASIVL